MFFPKRILLLLSAVMLLTACEAANQPAAVVTVPILVSATPDGISIEAVSVTATALSGLFEASPSAEVGVGGGEAIPDSSVIVGTPGPTMTPAPASISMAVVPTGEDFLYGTDTLGDAAASTTIASGLITPASTTAAVAVQISPLNAGEINDNAQWSDYLSYRNSYLARSRRMVHDVDINQRYRIVVTDTQGLPVLGARVMLYNDQTFITESRTFATGETLFFPSAWTDAQNTQSYRVVIQVGNAGYEFTLDPALGTDWHVALDDIQRQTVPQLDVLFLLDATGSMADEIAQLQNNIVSISTQINQTLGNIDVRYGLVAYRDRGDDYVTQVFDFVADVQTFQAQLNTISADGGGDTPESLNEAMHLGIHEMDWRLHDTIKLVFLVADAAPHIDYPNDYDYSHEMVAAAWQGIKIFPIASSGLTPDGEFIFRQIAQYTMGHFLFLTYEQGATSGAPGTTRNDLAAAESNNDYTVAHLDDLVLRLITDEITALNVAYVDSSATSPELSRRLPEMENIMPTFFNLIQADPPVAYSAPARVIPETVATDVRFSISLPQLLILVGGCLVVGFLLSAVYRLGKQKRKVEEIYASATPTDELVEPTP